MSSNAASNLVRFCLFLALWLILMLAGRSAMFRDPGTFWHVVVGEKIISSGQVPREDSFSFTFYGQPWVADQWLAEITMAAVHRLAGWDGLLTVAAAILAAVYTAIILRQLRAGLHWLLAAAILALVLLASSHQFHVRPLVFTLAGLAITFGLLEDVEAGRKSLHSCWLLAPLFIVWANLHGGVLAGVACVGLCVLSWCLFWATGKDSPIHNAREVLEMLALVCISGLGLLLNPYGPGLVLSWFQTLTMPLPNLIQEHGRLNLASSVGGATLGLAAIYGIALLGVFPRIPKTTWLLPLIFFVLALLRVRNAPLFALSAALALPDLLLYSRLANWLQQHQWISKHSCHAERSEESSCMISVNDKKTTPKRSFAALRMTIQNNSPYHKSLLPLILIAVVLSLQIAGISLPIVGRDWARFDSAQWPVELLPKLQKINENASLADQRIFNDLGFGGFLIYHTPQLKIFIDDRCPLYGSEFLTAYDHARREDPGQIDRWQRQYGFRYALVETGGPFDRYLRHSNHWTLLGRSPAAALYQYQSGISP